MKAPGKTLVLLGALFLSTVIGWATSNYTYGANEYDTVINGVSPDGKYAIATHGDGDLGYGNFHVYLMNNVSGKKIGPLEEISDNLDTGCDAFAAKWSNDSSSVYIVYRISRHEPLQAVTYRIATGRAYPQSKTHVDATTDQGDYWQKYGSGITPSPKIFGTPNPKPVEQGQ